MFTIQLYLNLCVILITASINCYLLTEKYVIISEQNVILLNTRTTKARECPYVILLPFRL